MNNLEKYYNKFNEDKRLKSRHGLVEHTISMHYIKKYLSAMAFKKYQELIPINNINDFYEFKSKILSQEGKTSIAYKLKNNIKIIDIGAGTGAYSIPLFNEGYDVTAVEPVKYNLGIMKQKCPDLTARKGNALKLKKYDDDSFDLCILFGPLYHLYSFEDKLKALNEAKRVTKKNGIIMVAYTMNEYSILMYAFKENHIKECLKNGSIDSDFQVHGNEDSLYDYVRLETIDELNKAADLKRLKIFSPDGPSDYMRSTLNSMDEETFKLFIKYQLTICERKDLLGAGSHIVDVLCKQ